MNKKVIYAVLAVVLVLVAVMVFIGIGTEKDTNVDLPSSVENKIEEVEEAPIIDNGEDVQEKRPEEIPVPTKEPEKEVKSTPKPQATSKPAVTKPKQKETPKTIPAGYEDFIKMSSEEQQKFVDSFASMDAFFDWYNAKKEAYEKANPPIEVDNDVIDMGDIIEEKN